MPDWRDEVSKRLGHARLDPAAERAIVEELAQHLEDSFADLLARGVAPSAASETLLRQLDEGGLSEMTRSTRRMSDESKPPARARSWAADLMDDIRYAIRGARKAPGFALVACATLALGIGATGAMYSVVDAVLVQSLPFQHAEDLVRVFRLQPTESSAGGNLSTAEFLELRAAAQSFASVATYSTFDNGLTLITADRAERLYGSAVSGDLFTTVGVSPLFGRGFSRNDDRGDAAPVVVISYGFWQRRLGGMRDVIGRTINLQGTPTTVVGVMPSGFWFPRGDRAEFWTNLRLSTPQCDCGFTRRAIARLRPGITPAQRAMELERVAETVRTMYPGGPHDWTFVTKPLRDVMVADLKPVLRLLMVAVLLVLLIACLNVVNLLLARTWSRQGEFAVRVALGANGARLARQLLVETSVLAIVGAVLGLGLSRAGLAWLLSFAPANSPFLHDAGVSLNLRVVGLATMCTMVCALGIGLMSVWPVVRSDANAVIRETTHGPRESGRRRLSDGLVVAQFAVSLMLVVGATLMVRSVASLRQVDLGVRGDGIVTGSVALPGRRYQSTALIRGFVGRLFSEIRTKPGVEYVAVGNGLPPDRGADVTGFKPEAFAFATDTAEALATNLVVSADYFTTLGIPLVAGRVFDSRDRDSTQAVVIVSATLAKRYFPDRNPLGQRIRIGGQVRATVVGVVGDVKFQGIATDNGLALYQPFDQMPQWSFSIIMRTDTEPLSFGPVIRNAVTAVDREIAVSQIQTIDDLVESSTAAHQFRAVVLSLLAGLALALAAIGIYGVLSYAVSRRTKEIGVRVALGARSADVLSLVLREGLARAALGVAIGLLGAWATTRLLSSMLFGVSATDLVTFVSVPCVLLAVAAIACWLPAYRAARVDPLIALRSD
jgi:putative ABC transport system permease protein